MVRASKYLLITIILLLSATNSFASSPAIKAPAGRPAINDSEVRYISARDYFDTALKEIQSAKKSVTLVMYLVALPSLEKNSHVLTLLEALVAAKNSGVEVEVVLDSNIDYQARGGASSGPYEKNASAAGYLLKNGIRVFWDNAASYLHAKVLVVDAESVLLGSSNWSASAFDTNFETDILVRSAQTARQILEDIQRLKKTAVTPDDMGHAGQKDLKISRDFFSGAVFRRIVEDGSDRVFMAYLHLLRISAEGGSAEVNVSHEDLIRRLGLEHLSPTVQRDKIHLVLLKLQEKYGLLEIKTKRVSVHEDIVVDLKNAPFKDPALVIPSAFWDFDWDRRLSFQAKVAYLIFLMEMPGLGLSNAWSMPVDKLTETYGVSRAFISGGIHELRRRDLLEVRYSEVSWTGDRDHPSTYVLKSFYDWKELEQNLLALEKKYGVESFRRARVNAALVSEDDNAALVSTMLDLEARYGEEVMKRAADVILRMKTDNPKRSAGYFINTIKQMGETNKRDKRDSV